MIQLANLIYRGVPELFPRLRLAFLEAGCSWTERISATVQKILRENALRAYKL